MNDLTEREKKLAAIALHQSLAISDVIRSSYDLKFTDPEVWFVFECRVCGCETHTNNPLIPRVHADECRIKLLEDARDAFDQWVEELRNE